jgi:hypothetical protein
MLERRFRVSRLVSLSDSVNAGRNRCFNGDPLPRAPERSAVVARASQKRAVTVARGSREAHQGAATPEGRPGRS